MFFINMERLSAQMNISIESNCCWLLSLANYRFTVEQYGKPKSVRQKVKTSKSRLKKLPVKKKSSDYTEGFKKRCPV